jgi:branched-subunit amino acid ABC-type transport system permease component
MNTLPQFIVNSVVAGSTYALVAMSFALIYGVSRFFNLAHGVLAAVAGYSLLYMVNILGLGLPLAFLIGIASAAFVGWACEFFIYRTLRSKKSSDTVLLVASLGVFTVIQAFIAILFTSQFQTLSGLINTQVFYIGTAAITGVQVALLGASVLTLLGLWGLLSYTSFGRAIRAISDDEEVAKIVGIHTNRVIGTVFIVGSSIMGLVGILIGMDTGLQPTMGLAILLKAVVGAIIGGIGNVYGAFFGGYLLGFAENFGIWHINGQWKDTISFIILILFLLFRPQGIFGKK